MRLLKYKGKRYIGVRRGNEIELLAGSGGRDVYSWCKINVCMREMDI